MQTFKTILPYLLIAILLSYIGCRQRNFTREARLQTGLIKSLQDTLKTQRNENNQQISQISVLIGGRKFLERELVTKDSILLLLQTTLQNNPKADNIIVTKVETRDVYKTSVDSVRWVDTIYTDSGTYVFPEYVAVWHEKWSKGKITANKDTISRDITLYNEFEAWQQVEGKGKNRATVVYWKNNNPMTETTGMRSWRVEPPKRKNFVLSLSVGGGLIVPEMKFRPYLGLSFGYKIFEF